MDELGNTPNMPIVNLMDPVVEPTDYELQFLMKDVQERATRKWHKARDAFWGEIDVAMRALK